MAQNLYSYYIHYRRRDYMNRRIARLKLSLQQHNDLTLQQAIQDQRTYLLNVASRVTLSANNKDLYKELTEIYTYMQYGFNKSEALNNEKYKINDEVVEGIRDEFINYLIKQPYAMNIPDTYNETIDLGHATKLFLDKNKNNNTISYSNLSFYKRRIESLLNNLEMHTSNINSAQKYIAQLLDLKQQLENIIQNLGLNSNNKKATFTDQDKNLISSILNKYSYIAKKVSGVSINWGSAAELFYAFGFASIGQKMIKEETINIIKGLTNDNKNYKTTSWTGAEKLNNPMLSISSFNFDFAQIEKDMEAQNNNISQVRTSMEFDPNDNIHISMETDGKATADFIGTLKGEDIGVSIKNYTAKFGGQYGITVLSGTNFLNLFSELNFNLQGHAANLMSTLYKNFPSKRFIGPPAPANGLKAQREQLKNIIVLTGAIRGLTGVRQNLISKSIRDSFASQILIINSVAQKRVYVFNTADIVTALLSLSPKRAVNYINVDNYPTSLYPNIYEGTSKNWEDAVTRNSKFFGWARQQSGITFHIKKNFMENIFNGKYA